MKGKARWRTAGEAALGGGITGALTPGLLEIALRLFAPQVGPEMQVDVLHGLFVPDPAAVYRNGPGAHVPFQFGEFHTSVTINAQGLRADQPVGPPAPGSTRLLALGDSF